MPVPVCSDTGAARAVAPRETFAAVSIRLNFGGDGRLFLYGRRAECIRYGGGAA
eukprot:gene26774-15546_t